MTKTAEQLKKMSLEELYAYSAEIVKMGNDLKTAADNLVAELKTR